MSFYRKLNINGIDYQYNIGKSFVKIKSVNGSKDIPIVKIVPEGGRKIVGNYGLDPKLGKYHRTYCDDCQKSIETKEPVEKCPMCGGKAEFCGYFGDTFHVMCTKCGCDLPLLQNAKEVIDRWNQRIADMGKKAE